MQEIISTLRHQVEAAYQAGEHGRARDLALALDEAARIQMARLSVTKDKRLSNVTDFKAVLLWLQIQQLYQVVLGDRYLETEHAELWTAVRAVHDAAQDYLADNVFAL